MVQNFLKITRVFWCPFILISLGTFFLECFKTEQRSLEVSIAIPGNDKEKSLIIYESSDKIIFHVLVKNVSNKEVRIWKDWNSWGYDNLSFQIQTDQENINIYKTEEKEWYKNFPDFWSIKPNEFVILNVNLDVKTWPKLKELKFKNDRVKIKCIYEIKEDPDTKQYNIWTGKIESSFVEASIYSYL
ncbi:hypothetical protein [Leptospira santarosai]|uniref:Lipoprotein n=1 Tax=Leptospira santarosai TaxID=28183 RepID=A0AB73LKN7_9LEPT|nr:hypothetical protein [Leptospira santarosai]MDI7165475.1 hypothetical protein [Leptospira santarosai]MDO6392919.1 hypothetical protein [Leptospira santarosai]OLY60504.1 hypothetical protein BV917_10415 [Leptospira santarosai serovar Guaricura]ONF91211.1 hypothetical protein BWD14_18145 [Leptospira santarosai]